MSVLKYEKEIVALLVIDPYNDFISEGGKFWPHLKTVAEANHCVPNMLQVLNAARAAKLRVFYPLHRRYRSGDYETWKYIAPIQKRTWSSKAFEYGTWGGEIRKEFEPQPGETVILEHWGSSGFANTDLDLQLKKHGIHQLIVTGLIAHTCVEATVRYAFELGYEVTMVRDATADYSDFEMHAALDVNIPNYASAIVTTVEIVEAISSLTNHRTVKESKIIGEHFMESENTSHHVYELRMYQVNDGKMDALIARFGDHTDAIFKRHNMKSIGFWRPQDEPYSRNLFVYILEHPSREEAKKNWAAFQADPEWKKVKADSETDGALANHIDSYFMDPTSFSALK